MAGGCYHRPPMHLGDLMWWQWALGVLGALVVGLSKTGVPGLGILQVPLFAFVLADARLSVGALVVLLLVGDCMSVAYYGMHAVRVFAVSPFRSEAPE